MLLYKNSMYNIITSLTQLICFRLRVPKNANGFIPNMCDSAHRCFATPRHYNTTPAGFNYTIYCGAKGSKPVRFWVGFPLAIKGCPII